MARVAATPARDTGKSGGSSLASVGRAVGSIAKSIVTPSTRTAGNTSTARVSSTPNRTAATSTSRSSGSSGGGSYSGGGSTSYSGGGSSSGGGASYSGGGSGGGGGADFGAASFAAPAPVMEDITIPDPLENPTYQKQKAELARARADFDAQQGLARSQYNASFDDSQRQLGWRSAVPRVGIQAQLRGAGNDEAGFDPRAQGTAYGDSYQGNEGDFAGRGLFNSGLFAQSVSNLNQNFNDRRGTALRDKKSYEDTQDLNKKNFYGQQDSADLAAREDAINSIIQQYGVSRDQVIPGRANSVQRASTSV